MTETDFKRLDKHLREIQDPFGAGFSATRKIVGDLARESGLSVHCVVERYVAWKWRK